MIDLTAALDAFGFRRREFAERDAAASPPPKTPGIGMVARGPQSASGVRMVEEARRDALAAVRYCAQGGGRPTDAGFRLALDMGLLAHDPVWRPTERGLGALVAAGLMAGEPAREQCTMVVVWAQHRGGQGFPQMVAAFPEGLADCWSECFAERRLEAINWFRTFGDPGDPSDWVFFDTTVRVDRPDRDVMEGSDGDFGGGDGPGADR